MAKIRICQLITELRPAGAERMLFELARRIDRDRFDVQVAALRGGVVADWLAEIGVKVTVAGMSGKWDLAGLRPIFDHLRDERIDILHTHLFHADLVGRLAAAHAGIEHLVHTVHVVEKRFRPWQFAFARVAATTCDRIIGVSQAVVDFHSRRSGLPAWRYATIPNGIDAAMFAHDPMARAELRERWDIKSGDVLLCYVGRLDVQKGLDVLLSAMSHLGARGKPMKLVIAGDGPQRFIVENFIAHGEGGRHTRYLGFVPDVRGVLSAADVFLMPSRWEGFGLAAAEAMAAGLPVIGTNVPGLREVLDDGRAGYMIEADDSFALSDAIETVTADPGLRGQLGQAGEKRVLELYQIDRNIRAHESLYGEIMGGR